jgi:hypothetical protein
VCLLVVVVVLSLVPVWLYYGSFDPARGRLAPDEHPLFFPVFMVHVTTASIALLMCVLQVWPRLRRKHPRIHRAWWDGSTSSPAFAPPS